MHKKLWKALGYGFSLYVCGSVLFASANLEAQSSSGDNQGRSSFSAKSATSSSSKSQSISSGASSSVSRDSSPTSSSQSSVPSTPVYTQTSTPTATTTPTATPSLTPTATCTPKIEGSCEGCERSTYRPGVCRTDSSGVIVALEPMVCRCKTDRGDNDEICNNNCIDVAERLGMTSAPVVTGETNCHEAQRQWCKMLNRRWKSTTGEHKCLGCITEEKESQPYKESWQRTPEEQRTTLDRCACAYPRFTGARQECPHVQLSSENFEEFKKRFESFLLDRSSELCDFAAYLLNESPVSEIDPEKFGLPDAEYEKIIAPCKGKTDFWAMMSCVGKHVQEYYDAKENRLKNFNGKPDGSNPTNCIVCRHYAATYLAACKKILAESPWADSASCAFENVPSHAWVVITVKKDGRTYEYVYDPTNDWGCMNLVPKKGTGFQIVRPPSPVTPRSF